MMLYGLRNSVAAAALGLGIVGIFAVGLSSGRASAQISVFDPANYTQNLLTAARALSQINNQIQSLQNEAQMLINQGKNLRRIDFPGLDKLRQQLSDIDRLMRKAQGLGFRVDQLDARYRQLFPDNFDQLLSRDRRLSAAKQRLDTAMASFRQTMGVQSQIVANVHDDAEALSQIVARSQGAEGSLEAQQSTNQLLALSAKQQFQIQQMMAAQFRGAAIEQARRGQIARESRATTRRFLGDGKAYTPRP